MNIKFSGKDFDVIRVRDVVANYTDNDEEGVTGYGGRLNIRPKYQREFVYKPKQRDEVIQTVRKGFPLNTMYWAVSGDGFELMDGQQRTISICQYVNGDYSIDWDGQPRGFNNLTGEEQQQILDYELSVYVCEGTDKEKLDWFQIINIASVPLTDQELRNAIYTGPWLTEAKRWFSKTGAPAEAIGEKLVGDDRVRQGILERALKWIGDKYGCTIEQYMADHQNDTNADELWDYYRSVIDWANSVFPNQDSARVRLMKGLEWGKFFNAYSQKDLNSEELEKRIVELIADEEVESKKGIYEYLLTGNERTLNLRAFEDKDRHRKYAEQAGVCPVCGEHYEYGEMEADHIVPWSRGGKTEYSNLQMLCRQDNNLKSNR